MGISIQNEEVETLIREIADVLDKPLTDAVREAATTWLEVHRSRERSAEEARQKRLDDILAEFRRWPVYDDRDHADILYDDDGLPK